MVSAAQLREVHPHKSAIPARAKRLYHAARHMPPEEGTALLAAALEAAERYGHRDPEVDGFAVLRRALQDAVAALMLGRDLEERLREACDILSRALNAADGEEDQGSVFQAAEVAA